MMNLLTAVAKRAYKPSSKPGIHWASMNCQPFISYHISSQIHPSRLSANRGWQGAADRPSHIFHILYNPKPFPFRRQYVPRYNNNPRSSHDKSASCSSRRTSPVSRCSSDIPPHNNGTRYTESNSWTGRSPAPF